MSPNKPLTIACMARAIVASTAASAVFATFAAAHAQTMEPARIVAPLLTPIAAPAGLPPVTRAVIAAPPRPVTPSALPQDTPAAAPPAACRAPTELTYLDRPLVRTARRLASGQPLTIVAIGSSSTAGAGASSADASYPSQLSVDLKQRFPGQAITVLNRGVNGEETENMTARFANDVIAAHPQLVLWQVGTNSVLRDRPLAPHEVQLHDGIEELKATGADVVLMDPQYSPKVLAKPETDGMIEQIALMAKVENVDLFQRFAVMRNWSEVQHLGFDTFVSPDGLHMNDWGYACVAKLLAGGIAEAATRPVASAAAPAGHPAR
jgi:lysophospholipase L1-like esterase